MPNVGRQRRGGAVLETVADRLPNACASAGAYFPSPQKFSHSPDKSEADRLNDYGGGRPGALYKQSP